MNWLTAATTGFGAGLVSFGMLWLTVRQLVRRPHRKFLLLASGPVRLFLVGVAFYGVSREGSDKLLAGLGGLWLARWCVIRRTAGV